MKTTILISENMKQIVLEPETKMDVEVVKMMKDVKNASCHLGSFYECQGGWTREGLNDDSLIIVCEEKSQDNK